MGATITERKIEVDGIGVFLREVPGEGPPAVFVHGNPTHSADWLPFLERMDGPALAFDLAGWGRSSRPDPLAFDGSMDAHANLVERLLGEVAPCGYRLVVHDWGTVGLIAAQRHPERLQRLVVLNGVPLDDRYRWHWVGRVWRRRGLGELFNATATRRAVELLLRLARAGRRPMPREFVDTVWDCWDAGTRRAILALYRSADPGVLGAHGSRLGELDCPALVIWGTRDPYIDASFGRSYADALPSAELIELDDAGHWPWIDRPDTIGCVADFLDASAAPTIGTT